MPHTEDALLCISPHIEDALLCVSPHTEDALLCVSTAPAKWAVLPAGYLGAD